MSKPNRKYTFRFKGSSEDLHIDGPENAAFALTNFFHGDEEFHKGLLRFFDDMEIGDTQHLESLTIMCREAF